MVSIKLEKNMNQLGIGAMLHENDEDFDEEWDVRKCAKNFAI